MLPDLVDPDRRFALLHVPLADRLAVHAIWAFDETLGRIVAGTRDAFVGQMRLTWWHEAVTTLKPGERRGEPILDTLAGQETIDAAALGRIVEGWEALIDPLPFDANTLLGFAAGRGGGVFDRTASILGGAPALQAGEGWALADFAKRCSDPGTAARAWSLARDRLAALPATVPRSLRILARLARADAAVEGQAARTRWRLLRATW